MTPFSIRQYNYSEVTSYNTSLKQSQETPNIMTFMKVEFIAGLLYYIALVVAMCI